MQKHKIGYFKTPVLTQGGRGDQRENLTRYLGSSHKVSQYLLINTFLSSKSKNKGNIRQKPKIGYFKTPVLTQGGRGDQRENLTRYLGSSHKVSQYLLINTFLSSKSKNKGNIRQKPKIGYFKTPVLTQGGRGDQRENLTRYLGSSHKVSQYLLINTFLSSKSKNKGNIRQKHKIGYFMTPV